jgi:flavin-dependent dehydrogenase
MNGGASKITDATVIGGGPAGLSAAIALARRGAKVTLFDAQRTVPRLPRIETLPARLRPVLSLIGAEGAIPMANAMAVPGLVSTWSSPSPHERPSIIDPHGPAFHVERDRFRSALAAIAVSAGVDLIFGGRAQATTAAHGWRVICGTRAVEASFLIVATGRDALPIAAPVSRYSVDRLVAVFARARQAERHRDSLLVVEAAHNGWWYRCPSAQGFQIVFLSDADLVRAAAKVTNDWFITSLAATEIGKDMVVEDHVRTVAADTYCREAVAGHELIVIGDAAMAGDPLAGDGVTWSVTSGLRAAEIVLGSSTDREIALADYSNIVSARFVEFLTTRSDSYGRVTRWPNSSFWSRRH